MRSLSFLLGLSIAGGVGCADFSGFHLGVDPGSPHAGGEDSLDGAPSPSSPEAGLGPDGSTSTDDGGTDAAVSDAATATGYATVVLADAPIAYWRLDESTGTTLHEIVKARHGTLVGKATMATIGAVSDGNPSLTFGTTPTRIDVGDHPDFHFDGGKPFTLEVWVKAKSKPETVAFVAKAVQPVPNVLTGWFFGTIDNVPLLSIDGAYLDAPSALPVSRFSHVLATSSGTSLTLYVDGASVATAAQSRTASSTPGQPLNLGGLSRKGVTDAALEGGLDEVAIYDKVLSPARIAAHAAAKR